MPAPHKSSNPPKLEIKNPFASTPDRAYADILFDKMQEMRWWRLIIGGGIILVSIINFAFFVYAVKLQKVVPVLVNVMPSGEAQYLGEVRQQGAAVVPEAAIVFQIRTFISDLRSVSTDPEVLYNNIEKCYAIVTSTYEPVMTRMLRGNSPFELLGKIRRTVEIESVIKITGASYQIDWYEVSAETGGSQRRARMRAVVTVKLLPTTDESIKKNPLGIYIENCEMTELK